MAILKVPHNGEWAIIESPSAVKFTEQTLSETEKARARDNIGAELQIYKQDTEPTDALVGALWVDTSEDGVIDTPDGIRQGIFDTLHVAGDTEIGGNLTFLNGSPFAPNGYGLGGNVQAISWADADNKYVDGTWLVTGDIPTEYGEGYGLLNVVGYDVNTSFQTLHLSALGNPKIARFCFGGVWQPWEWVNPPMHIGVEYRTTKRYNGRAVYKKLVTITSSVAAKATMLVPHGISDIESVLSVVCFRDRYTLPYEDSSGYTTFISYCDDTNIAVINNGAAWAENRTWHFVVSYTKD